MEGLFTLIVIVIWVVVGVLNVMKKRAESMEGRKPGERQQPVAPPRTVRPQSPRQTAPPTFTPKRETVRPQFAPKRQVTVKPRPEMREPARPLRRQTIMRPTELFGPPRPDVVEREEAFERAQLRPAPVARRAEAPRARRPMRRAKSVYAPVGRREEQKRYHFTDSPIVNGIIFSELLGPPLAKRPHRKRRMF